MADPLRAGRDRPGIRGDTDIADGAEAARLDGRQNQAIRELLSWACRRQRG